MSKYSKFLVAALGVVIAGLVSVYGNNSTVRLIVEIATALGVFAVPNKA